MVSDEEHFDPSESILKDSLNTIKSARDQQVSVCEALIELKGKTVKIPLLGERKGGEAGFFFQFGFFFASTFGCFWDKCIYGDVKEL